MNRLTLVATVLVAGCTGFVISALADGHDAMQLFGSDGKISWDLSGAEVSGQKHPQKHTLMACHPVKTTK